MNKSLSLYQDDRDHSYCCYFALASNSNPLKFFGRCENFVGIAWDGKVRKMFDYIWWSCLLAQDL